jgi:hypothetical protein
MNHRQVLRGASKLCSGNMGSPSCGLRPIQAGKGLEHDVLVTTSIASDIYSGKLVAFVQAVATRRDVPIFVTGHNPINRNLCWHHRLKLIS